MIHSIIETSETKIISGGGEMMPEIHPTAIIEGNVKLGKAVRVYAYAVIQGDITIGDYSVIGAGVHIFGKVVIRNNCKIQSHCFIPSGTTLGNNVFVSPGVVFLNDKFPPSHGKAWMPVVCEDGVTIGGGCTILPGVTIAKDVSVGGGSVVTKNLDLCGAIYFGNPARPMGSKSDGSEWGFYKDSGK